MNQKKKQEYIERMKKCVDDNDPENAHLVADDIIINMLSDLGHQDIVELWSNVYKWYA